MKKYVFIALLTITGCVSNTELIEKKYQDQLQQMKDRIYFDMWLNQITVLAENHKLLRDYSEPSILEPFDVSYLIFNQKFWLKDINLLNIKNEERRLYLVISMNIPSNKTIHNIPVRIAENICKDVIFKTLDNPKFHTEEYEFLSKFVDNIYCAFNSDLGDMAVDPVGWKYNLQSKKMTKLVSDQYCFDNPKDDICKQ